MLIEIEHFFNCPYCMASVSMILDLSAGRQEYIEDCEVCCRPLNVIYSVKGSELSDFVISAVEQ